MYWNELEFNLDGDILHTTKHRITRSTVPYYENPSMLEVATDFKGQEQLTKMNKRATEYYFEL